MTSSLGQLLSVSLRGRSTPMRPRRRRVEVLTQRVLQQPHVDDAIVFADADAVAESSYCCGRISASAHAR